jgi:hypothetical protein
MGERFFRLGLSDVAAPATTGRYDKRKERPEEKPGLQGDVLRDNAGTVGSSPKRALGSRVQPSRGD